LGCFVDIFILMNVLTLWSSVKRFTKMLIPQYCGEIPHQVLQKFQSCTEAEKILEKYSLIQELSNLINQSVGDCLIFYIAEDVLAYAMSLKNFLSLDISAKTILQGFYYSISVSVLLASSIVCRKVN